MKRAFGRLPALAAQLLVWAVTPCFASAAPAASSPALPAGSVEIATPCPARELRLAAAGDATLLLWQDGGGQGAKAGCKGETRAALIEGGAVKALDPDFLGAGFRQPGSGARAATLTGGRLVLVWAEGGAIAGAILAAGAAAPARRFPVTPEDLPSDVAAPRPLAKPDGGFLVIYESDFFSGRRRNPVWIDFAASGEPQSEPQPACADFVTVRDPLAALLPGGAFAVGGPGIGPVGDGFFLQFLGPEGDLLGEPIAPDRGRILAGQMAAGGENYVFTWNMRTTKGEERAFARLYNAAGQPLGAARDLGRTASAPALAAAAGGKALLAFVEPAPERRLRLLELGGAAEGAEPAAGPAVAEGTAALAIEPARRLLAWAEPTRIVVAPWP